MSLRPRGLRGALGLASLAAVVSGLTLLAQAGQAPVDMTGDGRTDFVVARNVGGGTSGAVTWWISNTATSAFSNVNWGIASDFFISGDFDGDNISDAAIWRTGPVGTAGFWIRRSSDLGVYFEPFGQTDDDPTVVGDYDGDGKTDIAIWREGAGVGQPSTWWVKRSSDGQVVGTLWGLAGDFPAPGDYDGDGAADYAVQRATTGGAAVFWLKQSTAGIASVFYGTELDIVAPGDYDGDGKTDLAVTRGVNNTIQWWIRRSSDLGVSATTFGVSETDFPTQGDYDGDGKTDVAVWRAGASTPVPAFWVAPSTGGLIYRPWGVNGDFPVANFNVH